MAKRNLVARNDQLAGFEESQAEEFIPVEAPAVSVLQLVLLQPITLKIDGPITGAHYVFPGAGSIVSVDSRDAEIMLLKRQKSSCCGSDPGYYFQLVGG